MKLFKKAAVALTVGAFVLGGVAAEANASGLTASLDQSSHLDRNGQNVTATISGVPAGEGIYVRECVDSGQAGVRPSTCVGISSTVWASLNAASVAQGATAFTGTVTVPVARTFTAGNGTAVDCEVSACGVLVRRDHLDPTDLSLDTFMPISFAPIYGVTVSNSVGLLNAGEHIAVTVAGLTSTQGVYVRICEQSGVAGVRPENCDGQGVWASMDPNMIALGAANAATPIDLLARANFTAGGSKIDCTKVACGVFVRRDHMNPSDTSLDTFVPVSFTWAAPVTAAKHISTIVTNNQVVVSVVGYKGVKLTLTVGSVTKTVTPTSNGYTFKVALAKGKKAIVKVAKGKTSVFSKSVKN